HIAANRGTLPNSNQMVAQGARHESLPANARHRRRTLRRLRRDRDRGRPSRLVDRDLHRRRARRRHRALRVRPHQEGHEHRAARSEPRRALVLHTRRGRSRLDAAGHRMDRHRDRVPPDADRRRPDAPGLRARRPRARVRVLRCLQPQLELFPRKPAAARRDRPRHAVGHRAAVRGMTTEPAMDTSTDRIERSIVIGAGRTKVWRALTNAEEFGTWFGADLRGQRFAPGQRARGPITFKGYEHLFFDVVVDRIEPEDLMSYRWHPYAHDPNVDYTKEEPTLVTFTLKDAPGNGTLLTVVET